MMGKRKIGRLTEKHYYPSARPEFLYGRRIDCWVLEPGRTSAQRLQACSLLVVAARVVNAGTRRVN